MDYLTMVKNRLTIDHSHSDEDILVMVGEGQALITGWTGKKAYDPDGKTAEDGIANSLIIEYVRYARSGASDMFRKNYLDTILTLQLEVAKHANPTA